MKEIDKQLIDTINRYIGSGIEQQVDYDKFYLYSLITHSTAIEGSTVTEVENQLLFDEGIAAKGRSLTEQMMNVDLKNAYLFGLEWIKSAQPYTVEFLCKLSAKVMRRTGSEYSTLGGTFDSSKGELRRCNVSAGIGGQRRRLGRTLLANNLSDKSNPRNFDAVLRSAVGRLNAASGDSNVTFHVCAGLAGGTGSGSIVDVMAQIRKLFPFQQDTKRVTR